MPNWDDYPVVDAPVAQAAKSWDQYPEVGGAPLTAEGLAKAGGTGVVKGAMGTVESVSPILGPGMAFQRRFIEPLLHKAENKPEEIVEVGGEVLQGFVGPGGIAKNLVYAPLKALATGAGVVGAGEAVKAAGGSEGAQKAAKVAASVAAPLFLNRSAIGRRPETPTKPDLYEKSDAGYKAVRESGAEYELGSVANKAATIAQDLENAGLSAQGIAPTTHGILKELGNAPAGAASVTASGLEMARQRLRRITGGSADRNEREAARRAIRGIDDYIASAGPQDVATGLGKTQAEAQAAARSASENVVEARGNYAAAKRSERITDREENATLTAESTHSGANYDNALRANVRDLLKMQDGQPKAKRFGFNDEEIANLRAFNEGGSVRNLLRSVSNKMGGGGGLGAAVWGLGGAATGGPAGIALATVPIIGSLFKKGQNALAQRAIEAVDEAVRQRSPEFQRRIGELPPSLARDLLNALRPAIGAIPNQ